MASESPARPARDARRATKYALLGAGALLTVFTGLVGFAHTSAGRPLLAWLRGAPGCPVGHQKADPAAVEKFRRDQVSRRVGTERARSHRAHDLELGATRLEQVLVWARAHGGQCSEPDAQGTLRCKALHVDDELPIADLFAAANTSGVLVSLDLMRHAASSREALGELRALERRLNESVGPVTREQGGRDASELDQPFSRVALDFAYSDCVVRLSATRMSRERVVVREHYEWAADAKLARNN